MRLLSDPAYARASVMVAPILLACFFQSAASLMDSGFYLRHRTGQDPRPRRIANRRPPPEARSDPTDRRAAIRTGTPAA